MDIDGENLHANLALAAAQYFSGADSREVAERILAAWPENAEAQGYLGAYFLLGGETRTAAVRSSTPRSSGRRKYRAATTRRARSPRFASSVTTTLSLRRCASTRRTGRWGTSSSRQRVRSAGAPDLAARGARAPRRAGPDDREVAAPTCCAAGASSRCSPPSSSAGSLPRRGRSARHRVWRFAMASSSIRLSQLAHEVLELRHRHARELHELDELLEALARRRFRGGRPTFRL